ncbi:MAG: hypothetical protein MUC68_17245, partial [Burkholderiaceae bacterium]|nr:hypothetical protein [Burkholderiaceae bacterium]
MNCRIERIDGHPLRHRRGRAGARQAGAVGGAAAHLAHDAGRLRRIVDEAAGRIEPAVAEVERPQRAAAVAEARRRAMFDAGIDARQLGAAGGAQRDDRVPALQQRGRQVGGGAGRHERRREHLRAGFGELACRRCLAGAR